MDQQEQNLPQQHAPFTISRTGDIMPTWFKIVPPPIPPEKPRPGFRQKRKISQKKEKK